MTHESIIPPDKQEATEGLVPAEIVSDRRDMIGRRIPILALFLVLLYFVTTDQIQSAQNGDSIHHLTDSQSRLLKTVKRDEGYVILASQYIGAQQKALKTANRRLKAAGLKPVILPPPPSPPPVSKQGHNATKGGNPSPRPTPSGHSHPSHSPSPHPSNSNSPPASPPVKICTDLPVLGHSCIPPSMFLGALYAVIR